jgi:hypothetical protein
MKTDKYGIIKDVFTGATLENCKEIYQKVSVTKTKYGDTCWGIDINCLAYSWFMKKLMPVIQRHLTAEAKLIFSSFMQLSTPLEIHHDIKPIPNNMPGKQYRSILFPFSVEGDRHNLQRASTRFYDELNEPTAVIKWEPNSMIWWDSTVLHDSGAFNKLGIKYKEYFITHTYV